MSSVLSRFINRNRSVRGVLAVTLGERSMRFVLASATRDRPWRLVSWGVSERDARAREIFLRRVGALLPEAAQTLGVLDRRDYRIIPVEAPNVPSEELRSAVRWKAAEYLEGSAHDYTIDVLPLSSSSGKPSHVIAVAAHNALVKQRMQECASIGHALSVIDVCETGLRNMLMACLDAEGITARVAAALSVDAGRALVIVAVAGEIRFFRRFEFDADMLAHTDHDINSALIAQGGVGESMRRSLDQLQRTLQIWGDSNADAPVEVLMVDAGPKSTGLVTRLRAEFELDVRRLASDKIFTSDTPTRDGPWHDPAFTPLLGSLLRAEELE